MYPLETFLVQFEDCLFCAFCKAVTKISSIRRNNIIKFFKSQLCASSISGASDKLCASEETKNFMKLNHYLELLVISKHFPSSNRSAMKLRGGKNYFGTIFLRIFLESINVTEQLS